MTAITGKHGNANARDSTLYDLELNSLSRSSCGPKANEVSAFGLSAFVSRNKIRHPDNPRAFWLHLWVALLEVDQV